MKKKIENIDTNDKNERVFYSDLVNKIISSHKMPNMIKH